MQSDRRRMIVELVQESGSKTVAELCDLFDVSEMTIRRDLRDLDREGVCVSIRFWCKFHKPIVKEIY